MGLEESVSDDASEEEGGVLCSFSSLFIHISIVDVSVREFISDPVDVSRILLRLYDPKNVGAVVILTANTARQMQHNLNLNVFIR